MSGKRTYIRLQEDEHELLTYIAMLCGKCRGEYLKDVAQREIYRCANQYAPVYEKQQELIARRVNRIAEDGR